MEQLETALKFYDANLKILTLQEKDGEGARKFPKFPKIPYP